jgi:predicted metal-binding protein
MVARNASKPRAVRPSNARLLRAAKELGVLKAKVISPSTVRTAEWVRRKCQYGCGCWGTTLCCPPRSPTPEQTRRMLAEYRRAILFEGPRGKIKKIAAALERQVFLAGCHKAFGMGAGPCRLCRRCAFEEGCRHPDQARPAMEASGIDVFATVRRHGFAIDVVHSEADPQHYFGLVLVD